VIRGPMNLTLLSWNILAPMWVHPDYFPGISENIVSTKFRRESFYATLKYLLEKYSIDVIGFQEAQESEISQPEFLKILEDFEPAKLSKNEPQCWESWLKTNEYQENGTIIYLRKGRFSDIQTYRYLISEDGNAATLITCTLHHQKLLLINTHLETVSSQMRQIQVQNIQSFIHTLLPATDRPPIYWLGDFNMKPQDPLNRALISGKWRDFVQEICLDFPTWFSVKRAPARIDFIYGLGDMRVMGGEVPHVLRTGSWGENCAEVIRRFGSDHLPILVKTVVKVGENGCRL